ncbi:MAG: hypothetical protein IH945_01690, partial [Armatimonadetes bacterium]|nr:hypothetical protein [Armatimonadota bacterium]
PIQFPEGGATIAKAWQFKKQFGESDVSYTCSLLSTTDGIAKISVQIVQEYELLENAALEVVKEEIDAERRVKTTLVGSGVVFFDMRKGIVREVLMVNDAHSEATSLIDGEKTERNLKTTFFLKLREKSPPPQTLLEAAWRSAKDVAGTALAWAKSALATVRLAIDQLFRSPAGK